MLNSDSELAHVSLFDWARDHQLSALILKVRSQSKEIVPVLNVPAEQLAVSGAILGACCRDARAPFRCWIPTEGWCRSQLLLTATIAQIVLQSMELLAQFYTQSGQFIQAAKIYNQLADFDWFHIMLERVAACSEE